MILGGGSYGKVIERNGKACKQFDHTPFLIQEYAAGRYLRDVQGIIRFDSVDFREKSLEMPLYSISLDKFIDEYTSTCKRIRMDIFRDIVVALSGIHSRGMLHGDIKPGNVLLKFASKNDCFCSNCTPSNITVSAVICDLGFVSLTSYAKIEYTTLVYSDETKHRNISHDMYSLGILALELFGSINIHHQLSRSDIKQIINDEIESETISKMILSLTNPDQSRRMTTSDILQDIYGINDSQKIKPNITMITDINGRQNAKSWMQSMAVKYNVNNVDKGVDIICHYIRKNNISRSNFHLYSAVCLLVISSVFGSNKFQVQNVEDNCKVPRSRVLAVLEELMNSDEFIDLLFG